jgi:hypothetical protein
MIGELAARLQRRLASLAALPAVARARGGFEPGMLFELVA